MRCHHIKSMPLIGATAAALLIFQSPPAAYANVEAATPAAANNEGSITQSTVTAPAAGTTAAIAADSSAGAPAEQAKAKPLPPSLIARINLTSQTMTVQAAGKTLHTWKVSTGAPGYATPPGKFRPGWMAKIWHSRQYDDAPMPNSVFFNRGIAVHATTSIGNLGRAASHGCVRLAPANAEKFYNLVSRHGMARTQIVVHGAQPFSLTADRIGKIDRQHAQSNRASRAASAARSRSNRTGNEWIVVTPPRASNANRSPGLRRSTRVVENGYSQTHAAVQGSRRPASRSPGAYGVRY